MLAPLGMLRHVGLDLGTGFNLVSFLGLSQTWANIAEPARIVTNVFLLLFPNFFWLWCGFVLARVGLCWAQGWAQVGPSSLPSPWSCSQFLLPFLSSGSGGARRKNDYWNDSQVELIQAIIALLVLFLSKTPDSSTSVSSKKIMAGSSQILDIPVAEDSPKESRGGKQNIKTVLCSIFLSAASTPSGAEPAKWNRYKWIGMTNNLLWMKGAGYLQDLWQNFGTELPSRTSDN